MVLGLPGTASGDFYREVIGVVNQHIEEAGRYIGPHGAGEANHGNLQDIGCFHGSCSMCRGKISGCVGNTEGVEFGTAGSSVARFHGYGWTDSKAIVYFKGVGHEPRATSRAIAIMFFGL